MSSIEATEASSSYTIYLWPKFNLPCHKGAQLDVLEGASQYIQVQILSSKIIVLWALRQWKDNSTAASNTILISFTGLCWLCGFIVRVVPVAVVTCYSFLAAFDSACEVASDGAVKAATASVADVAAPSKATGCGKSGEVITIAL